MLIQFRKWFDGHVFGGFVELAELAVRYERNQQAESTARPQSFFARNDEPFRFETAQEVDVEKIFMEYLTNVLF